jgi:hypothetical protein
MSASDGTIIGTTQILNNGSDINRFNIALLSEGYQAGQMAQFATDANAFVRRLSQTAPFHLAMNAINVFRVDVTSTDSGADDPVACGGTGRTARTYFDATFCGDGVNQRLCNVNATTAFAVANAQVPRHRLIVVIVNSAIFGGAGGSVAVYSLAGNAVETAIHEIGHTAFALADEYETLRGCASGETDHNNDPAVLEPSQVNITITGANNRSTLKWGRYVLPSTPLPTTKNANCAVCDPQPSPVATGVVGAFEGANTYHCRSFRSEFDCKMRTLGTGFCRVCQDAILRKLYPFSPLTFRFAWKGVSGDQGLYSGRGNDSDQRNISGSGSSTGPALATFVQTFMAWKGIFNDQGIYYSQQRHIDGVTWDTQQRVPGVGTSTGPALAVFQRKLYMAWKGAFNDQDIWFSSLDLTFSWAPQRNVPGVGTSTRPALAAFQNRLYMVWKGIAGDQSIWFSSYDGANWAPQAPVPNVGTSASPSLAVLGNRLYMVWKGIEGDQSVWFTNFDGFTWAPQSHVPNVGTSSGVSLCAGPDRIFMVWSGIAGDPSLYYTAFDGSFWGPQHNYLDTGSSSVPAVLVTF